MNAKSISKALRGKMDDWVKNIADEKVREIIKENAIITGGAIVSLLQNEPPNDYDVYFKTKESCEAVAAYYVKEWNAQHTGHVARLKVDGDRIQVYIGSVGALAEKGQTPIDDESEPDVQRLEEDPPTEKPKYHPRYISTNAIALSDKIQIVIRFYGSVEQIHENYDFVHCTCSFDYETGEVNLPSRALEAIINKELFYTGSKYPLCSIIRSRKFIQRGWSINAGQYLKMCLQLNELNLKDLNVFADQLVGVDSAYFSQAIAMIQKRQELDPTFQIDNTYLFEVINRIF